jgi:integrase
MTSAKRLPSAREIDALTEPGRYAVGHGVYLQISTPWKTRAWVFRYMRDGKAHHMGLGSAEYVTLAQAREKGYALRQQLILNGVDPLEAKRGAAAARATASVRQKTFRQIALAYIEAHEDQWRGTGSRRQWMQSLEKHALPKIGSMPIADIDVAAILSVLDPIAREIPETTKRVRRRIAAILDWAAARDLRLHDNPAKRPNLLPKRKRRITHFKALPYTDIPRFMVELRQRPEQSARTLELLILTAARPGEIYGMRWSEIQGDSWVVPANRMKGGREHRVPLSAPARELLANLPRIGEFVFPGHRDGKMYADAMNELLARMSYDVHPHGFRSTFRDWAAETTAYPNHVVEQALAHAIGNGVEAAYRRGDLFEKRQRLMDDWARYCSQPGALASARKADEVVTLRGVS